MFYDSLKSATKFFSVLLASKRPLITELALRIVSELQVRSVG